MRLFDILYARLHQEHTVKPGMVYISHPTENGTTYTLNEIAALKSVCEQFAIPLFMDGARLGYGLAAPGNDLFLPDIAEYCDVFYIGGTKVGALFGEAVVICNDKYKQCFRYCIKQRGGMLAKGRLLGIQFDVLFSDGLYDRISSHAVDMAMKIKKACEDKGYSFRYDSNTNQQFPVMPKDKINSLLQKYSFFLWEDIDETLSAVRFCTSWATTLENTEHLVKDILE